MKPASEVGKLIAGSGIYVCDQCIQACVDILDQAQADPGSIEQQLPSWQSLTDDEILQRIPRIAAVASQVDGGLRRWVTEAHRRGSSWADIGDALGMSRQSAWERFSGGGSDD
jgi:broad specificity phosphatase PhoE